MSRSGPDQKGSMQAPESWSIDGKILLFSDAFRGAAASLFTLPLDGERKTKLLMANSSNNALLHGAFSPDGRWLAYMSAELGDGGQVFVQPFPLNGAKYQISTEGGRAPLWSPEGKEIIYHNPSTNRFVVVNIKTAPSFTFGKPITLPIEGTLHPVPGERNYDITADGKQLVVVFPASTTPSNSTKPPTQQINVVLNWSEELKQRVPVK
jgi:WD40 repeat protein